MNIISELKKNLGANSLNSAIIFLYQIISVPVFLKYWGVNLYGEWILLTSFAAYLAISDLGLNTVTSNEFSILFERKEYKKCLVLFNNNLFVIIILFSIVFIIIGLTEFFFPVARIIGFKMLSNKTVNIGLLIITFNVLMGMISHLFNGIYRSSHAYARGLLIDNIVLIFEYASILILIMIRLNVVFIILFIPVSRTVGLIYKVLDTRQYFSVKINFTYFSWIELKRILGPSIAFLSFPAGNAVIIQGFILLINSLLGSANVVLFSTTRTLINTIKKGTTIMFNSFWPEFSLAYGRGDKKFMKKIYQFFFGINIYYGISAIVILIFFGKEIFLLWTKHQLEFNNILFYLFLLSTLTNFSWFPGSMVLIATNKHVKYAYLYLFSTIAGMIFAYSLVKFTNTITYLPLSLILVDSILIPHVFRKALKIIGYQSIPKFLVESFKLPIKTGFNLLIKNKLFF